MLPQASVDTAGVQTFQAKLQGLLKDQVRSGRAKWETIFSPRHPLHAHPLAETLNGVTTIATKDMPSTHDDSGIGGADISAPTIAANDRPPAWW